MKTKKKVRSYIDFFEHFIRNPKVVGAVAQFSDQVAFSMLEPLSSQPSDRPKRVLEVGAGMGNISQILQNHLHPHDHLDVVEIDSGCCQILRKRFLDDSRIRIHCKFL